jgi:hypothetical protein
MRYKVGRDGKDCPFCDGVGDCYYPGIGGFSCNFRTYEHKYGVACPLEDGDLVVSMKKQDD